MPANIVGYIDSKFAESKNNPKSIRSYFFILVKTAISHLLKF